MDALIAKLKKLEKQNYRAYSQIRGQYDFSDFILHADFIQSDPYASDSRFRAIRPWSVTGLDWLKDQEEDYQIAARDFIARQFERFAKDEPSVSIATSGQIVLDSTAVLFTELGIEIRFRVKLPASGREILGKKAINILTFHLPKFIRRATLEREIDIQDLKSHCELYQDQCFIRAQLDSLNISAFVANNAILPRASGNSPLPLKDATPFVSPESLVVSIECPNAGKITGMGIPNGVTLIVGGGFHGKSTLLKALEKGVYNHIHGDGREWVVSRCDSVKIRAEEGRCVHNLNISNFLNHLPQGKSTDVFTTQDASGSTSQAAWLQEAIESQTRHLLIDEDTSATNFMIRDTRMQALVNKGQEPITPLIDRIRPLFDQLSISTTLVMGGSGDYLDVADTVIQMHDYLPIDVTAKAKEIVEQIPTQRINESESEFKQPQCRKLLCSSLLTVLNDGKFRVSAKAGKQLRFGKEQIDLQAIEQLENGSELHAIGWVLLLLAQTPAKSVDVLTETQKLLASNWHEQMPYYGDLNKPRIQDVMSAVNRLRKAKFIQ